MPDVWKPQPATVYADWVDFILCHGKDVTDWEQKYTKDIQRQLGTGRTLTQRQSEILERIYSEKT